MKRTSLAQMIIAFALAIVFFQSLGSKALSQSAPKFTTNPFEPYNMLGVYIKCPLNAGDLGMVKRKNNQSATSFFFSDIAPKLRRLADRSRNNSMFDIFPDCFAPYFKSGYLGSASPFLDPVGAYLDILNRNIELKCGDVDASIWKLDSIAETRASLSEASITNYNYVVPQADYLAGILLIRCKRDMVRGRLYLELAAAKGYANSQKIVNSPLLLERSN